MSMQRLGGAVALVSWVIGLGMLVFGLLSLFRPTWDGTCGGRKMQAGDVCNTYMHGRQIDSWTFAEKPQNAERRDRTDAPWLIGVGGVVMVVCTRLSNRWGR
jgi:hypothetical protein